MKWYPLVTSSRHGVEVMIQRSSLELYDNPYSFGTFSREDIEAFHSEETANRDLNYKNRFWNAITYEVSLTGELYTRRVYGILDCASEMGGLFNAFSRVFLLIITGINYYGSY